MRLGLGEAYRRDVGCWFSHPPTMPDAVAAGLDLSTALTP
jgi:hypothetical protein